MSKDDLFVPIYGCVAPVIYDKVIDKDELKPFYGCIAVDDNSGFGTKLTNTDRRKLIVHLIDALNDEVNVYEPAENERLNKNDIFEFYHTLLNYRSLFDGE